MAPSSNYTVERMRDIGRSSADRAWSSLERSIAGRLQALTCEYLGTADGTGSFLLHDTVRANSSVAYQWTATGDRFSEVHVASARVDKVAAHGVALPRGWKTALRNLDLPDIIKRHLELARTESKVPGLGCRLLGTYVSVPVSDTGYSAGSILPFGGVAHVLCANVTDDQWLCHRGSFDAEGTLDDQNPLQVKGLVVMDLANLEAIHPRKRICGNLLTGQLRQYVVGSPRAFDALVAAARFRAAEMRAARECQDLQDAAIVQQFESSPWRWSEQAWDVSIYLLWTWHNRGSVRKAISSVRLDNLRNLERKLAVPEGLGDADYVLWRSLEQVATAEAAARKAPCRYLGVQLSSDKFEPDPSRFIQQRDYPGGRRSQAEVWYEWQGVTCCGGQPHRASVYANNVLGAANRRSLPQHPLDASAVGANFCFDVNFMKHVGANVHSAIQFKGVVFDNGDRADFRVQVPNGGVNIHHEPVYWSMPDGRVVCLSLLELKEKREDELFEESSTHEAYRAVAKELGQLTE